MDKIPSEFYSHYQPIVDREMVQVQNKQKSLDEALRSIQNEGQVVLDQVIKNKVIKKEAPCIYL
ncbi:hypothetical protein EJP82_16130 [Paenibacillus anaericanus]|uniref:Uncharacterized protein n=2 Tax=Paenibacillus anaericanus TaxID=170367 RepID=A0A3S1DTT8_9BACL|nr:hypothetical protein [Paenibacillus anaericanus]RUT45207.1 hypothetical protein EJP82_16130 [Paenibacillus anaericanus]